MNIIRSIINFFGAEDVVDGIGERGMRDSSIIKYNEVIIYNFALLCCIT